MRDILQNQSKTILIMIGLAFLLRMSYFAISYSDPQNFLQPDSGIYTSIAKGIVDTGQYYKWVENTDPPQYVSETQRLPGYPLWISWFYTLFGESNSWVVVFQILMDCLTCLFCLQLISLFYPNFTWMGGLLFATSFNLIIHSALILPDSIFLTWLSGFTLFFIRFLKRENFRDSLISSCFYSLAFVTKPAFFYFAPIFLIVFYLAKKRWKEGVIFVTFLMLISSPILIRNQMEYKHFGMMTQAGDTFLMWHIPLLEEIKNGTPYNDSVAKHLQGFKKELNEKRGQDHDLENPFVINQLKVEYSKEQLKQYSPLIFIQAWLRGGVINLMTPSVSSVPYLINMDRARFYETNGSNLFQKVFHFLTHPKNKTYFLFLIPSLLWIVFIRVIQIIGAIKFFKSPVVLPEIKLFIVLFTGYIFGVAGPLVNASRYRLPAEPFFILFAVAGVIWVLDRLKSRNHGS